MCMSKIKLKIELIFIYKKKTKKAEHHNNLRDLSYSFFDKFKTFFDVS